MRSFIGHFERFPPCFTWLSFSGIFNYVGTPASLSLVLYSNLAMAYGRDEWVSVGKVVATIVIGPLSLYPATHLDVYELLPYKLFIQECHRLLGIPRYKADKSYTYSPTARSTCINRVHRAASVLMTAMLSLLVHERERILYVKDMHTAI